MDGDKLEWEKRGEGFFYTTSPNDIGRGLKVVCTPRDASGKVGIVKQCLPTFMVTCVPNNSSQVLVANGIW